MLVRGQLEIGALLITQLYIYIYIYICCYKIHVTDYKTSFAVPSEREAYILSIESAK